MRYIVPFFMAMVIVLFICTYIPEISLALPRWFGLIK